MYYKILCYVYGRSQKQCLIKKPFMRAFEPYASFALDGHV